jgi:hypothetical protein
VGVQVGGAATTGNAIRGNSIHSNVGLEIDTANGGNNELAPPIVANTMSASASGFACANCAVDIFSDNSTDARFYEGSTTAAVDGSFTFVNESPFIGSSVTATNTDAGGNTSELAATVAVDSDGDGTADGTDTDDDNDGILDASDGCRVFPEDYDGYQDADGCPEPDNDNDAVCDAGQTSVSCTGIDTGQTCFDPAGTLPCAPIDCRNIAEDYDAFKDTDGCPEPDNDNDGFPDATDQCPGTSSQAGADGMLGSPQDANHTGVQDGAEPTLTTDDIVKTFEDYDLVLNTDGCHDSPGEDFDGDGYTDDDEALFIGTNPGYPCGINGWPSNVNDAGISANWLDILDVTSFVAPVRHFEKSPGDFGFDARWDIRPGDGGLPPKYINILDVTTLVAGPTGNPPMLNGARAFGKACPLPPQ